jgi:4'-phosphopantetheinyl transferase EntD
MRESLKILNRAEVDQEHFERWHTLAINRMPDVHPRRKEEWALARLCLELCLEDLGIKLKPSEIVFKNNHFIEKLDHLSFSLSHTKTWAAAFVAPVMKARQVGVDIELRGRKVPDNVKHRLLNPLDISLSPLELWVIKEAAYKSLPAIAQQGIWLNNIVVSDAHFELQKTPFKGRYLISQNEDLVISQAYYE